MGWRAIGIGIATGELIVGEIGYPQRTEYTAIGRATNWGAHLCNVAKGGQILISQATYDLVQEKIVARPITGLKLKGIERDVTAYELVRVLD